MLPVILAAGGAAVGVAITYYFVSNHGNVKREELLRKLGETLDVLAKKAEVLKKAKQAAEAAATATEAEKRAMKEELDVLREELARTQQEMDELSAEAGRWRASTGTWASGLSVVTLSGVLYKAKWQHAGAISYLEDRIRDVKLSTLQLDAAANRNTPALR